MFSFSTITFFFCLIYTPWAKLEPTPKYYRILQYQNKMTIQIREEQYKVLEAEATRWQLKSIILDYTEQIESVDKVLADKIRRTDENISLKYMQNVYDLTSVEQYQIALFVLMIDTGIDVFEHEEFSYIIHHSFLCGNAKARHIILSCTNILEGS